MMSEQHLAEDDQSVDPRVVDTPGRAAFLCTSTAEFHPPEWACMPIEANEHVRLEAFRDSRHCATYMVSTQLVNLFGRDQESCNHVLGNPSISRKHAAVIHDSDGGVYMVDLMSRHGTYVGRKKIPPHDPYLLHEGDIIKFGQSVRVYVLKGASADGKSAVKKKSWGRVKLRAPHVSLPKMSSSKPKASAEVVKIVNAVCYGKLKDEKVDAFVQAVLELSHEERKEVADTLVERIQAKYEFYAVHVHRNAFVATVALLKQNLCVEEFDDNLATITHISQHRHDSIYRADARKLLQLMAAVRADPDNIQFNDTDSIISNEDGGPSCPPTASHAKTRERVLSDEGKKLFLNGHNMPPFPGRTDSTGALSDSGMSTGSHRETMGNADPRYTGHYPSSVYSSGYEENDMESESRSTDNGYAPPVQLVAGNGHTNGYPQYRDQAPAGSGSGGSGFNFIGQPAPEAVGSKGSAFGFIAGGADPVDDGSSNTSSTDRPSMQSATSFDFMQKNSGPKPPSVAVEDFLVEHPNIEGSFEDLWESAKDESEEWSVEVGGAVDAHELNTHELQVFLENYRLVCLSSEKVGGQQQWLFVAEQKAEGTIFLVEISVMPGLAEMTVTLKWIVNSLLYRNGHIIFMEILKYALHQFCQQAQLHVRSTQPSQPQQHHYAYDHNAAPMPALQQQRTTPQHENMPVAPARTVSYVSSNKEDDDEEEEEDEEEMSARDYLVENPAIDAAKFEQVWATAPTIAAVSYTLNEIPEKDEVIELFRGNCLSCLASGSVNQLFKFFFFAEMTELQCVFCVEMAIDAETGSVEGTIKRLAIQQRSEEEEEQIDSSFVSFFEDILQEL